MTSTNIMNLIEKDISLFYFSSGGIQKSDKCVTVLSTTAPHILMDKDRHLDRKEHGGQWIPWHNLLRKTLIKDAKFSTVPVLSNSNIKTQLHSQLSSGKSSLLFFHLFLWLLCYLTLDFLIFFLRLEIYTRLSHLTQPCFIDNYLLLIQCWILCSWILSC